MRQWYFVIAGFVNILNSRIKNIDLRADQNCFHMLFAYSKRHGAKLDRKTQTPVSTRCLEHFRPERRANARVWWFSPMEFAAAALLA